MIEWDDEMAQLAHVARACDHQYEGGFCAKCGWERGSHSKIVGGSSPEPLAVPVSSSFTGPEPGSPPSLVCRTCAEALDGTASGQLHKEMGHRVVWVKNGGKEG